MANKVNFRFKSELGSFELQLNDPSSAAFYSQLMRSLIDDLFSGNESKSKSAVNVLAALGTLGIATQTLTGISGINNIPSPSKS